MMNLVYALIGAHGITDMSYPFDVWGPIYAMMAAYFQILPYRLLLFASYGLSAYHFSCDGALFTSSPYLFYGYLGALAVLLRFRRARWSQNLIVSYLGLVHSPLHLARHMTEGNGRLVVGTFLFLSVNPWIQTYIQRIVRDNELSRDTYVNRCLLSIVDSHILTMALQTHLTHL